MNKEELLKLDTELYNRAMELQWIKEKKEKHLSGDLLTCKHCGRKYVICCICEKAERDWENTLQEVKDVAEYYFGN